MKAGLGDAKKLKKIGLEWYPEKGDYYFADNGIMPRFCLKCADGLYEFDKGTDNDIVTTVWLPRIDQLIDEINKHNTSWNLAKSHDSNEYLFKCSIKDENGEIVKRLFCNDSLGKIFGETLLWILEGFKR